MKNHFQFSLSPVISRVVPAFVTLLVLFFLPVTMHAQWNTNTFVNLQISSLPVADMQSAPTTDGKTWIAYYHENAGNYDMRAQLIDENGYKLLGADGILVGNYTSGSATYVFNVCVDASNNLIIGYQDERSGSLQSVLYKISEAGTQLWGANGIVLGGGLAPYPAALSNGEVVVAWNGDAGNTLNLQKITTGGTTAWGTPIQVLVGSSTTSRGQIVANTTGKFTMVYQVGGMYSTLYAQMFDNNGIALYPPLQICNQTTAAYRYYSIAAESDVTYYGYYSSTGNRFNSFLQRINSDGTMPWGMNGSAFNTSVGTYDDYQTTTFIKTTAGSDYVWSVCTFCDYNQTIYGVYTQKFLKATGARQFTDAGKLVFPVSSTEMHAPADIALISDSPMFMVYDANYKIYATRLDASGNFVWPGDKVEISSTTAGGSTPKGRYGFTPDGPNRCAGIWTENRGSAEFGYAQGISIGGLIGLSVATQGGVPAIITSAGGTLQMVATIFPSSANQNVTWSIVPGTGAATISPTGLVTAVIDGSVYAKAIAVQDNTMKDSLMITISGQVPLAPSVTTLAATNISGTGVTLNGSVIAHNASTSVTFNWGTSIAYGNTIAASPSTVTGNTATQVLAGLSGLSEGTTYHFRCVGTNSVGTTYGSDLSFTTCLTPATPGTIGGSAVVCQNQNGVIYSISPVLNATNYNWSVPAGALITAGSGTTSITVSFSSNATSGNVTVTGVNSCTSGSSATKAVSVNTAPNPTIAGSNTVCLSSVNYTYSTEAGMNNYTWAISAGGSILTGAGTNSIQVHWNNAGAQSLSVNYNNSNGCQAQNPTLLNVTVNNKPDAASVITGLASVCAGDRGIAYSIDPVAGATTYEWLLPSGASLISGSGTNSITVNYSYNAVSGPISVTPQNSCGNGTGSNLNIIVSAAPPNPVIIANGYLLTSNAPSGNQWFLDGYELVGATSQTYTAHATGWYWTVVNTGSCSSDSSNNIYILWVGTTEHEAGNIDISPVPNDGHFSIAITSPSEVSYTLDIYNNLGLLVFGNKTVSVNRTTVIPVDLGYLPGGLYTVVLHNSNCKVLRKILVNK
ncbi:MAG: Ig-like domain-containing protein [Bacteroidota bacterium]